MGEDSVMEVDDVELELVVMVNLERVVLKSGELRITNTLLKKMQTGIEVNLIMQVFMSRCRSPAACHMSCASLQKLCAGVSGEIMERIQSTVQ
jgi:hypothetical protein